MKVIRKLKPLLLVAGGLSVFGLLMLRRGPADHPTGTSENAPEQVQPTPESSVAPKASPPAPARPPSVARRPPPSPARPVPTELSLMSAIRELGASDPARALELARDGNRRFPDSEGAPERSWTICKSLAALGRAAEAQDEARRMVQRYPDTSWAADVKRHLLTHPLEDPTQRGYGKSSEL